MRRGDVPAGGVGDALPQAVARGVLTEPEAVALRALLALRAEVVRVDERPLRGRPGPVEPVLVDYTSPVVH